MKANIMCKVIEMTKTEAKKAGIIGTAEFEQLKELQNAYPTFRIEVKASKSKSSMKGLTIPYMKKYIEAHDDAEKTNMTIFNTLRGLDENGKKKQFAQAVPYGILKQWFLTYFPEVADMNNTIDEILKKAQAKREAAKKAA